MMLFAIATTLGTSDTAHRAQLAQQQHNTQWAQTQRWNGAQSRNATNISRMDCTFRVPHDSEIEKMPQPGTQECHYIYCDMHYNYWPGSVPGWKVFGQFVPQLMRGFCTSGNTSGFAVKDTWLASWHIQSQYIWSTPRTTSDKGRVLAWAGELVPVSPGSLIHTRIAYSEEAGYTLSIASAEQEEDDHGSSMKSSELVVHTPFCGTNPRFTAPYGSPEAPPEYYQWVLGDLHEAWGMDEAGFYPTRQQWNITYRSEPAALAYTVRDDCKVHAGAVDEDDEAESATASCAPHVMSTHLGAVREGAASFVVRRAPQHAARG